ncbi:poly-gamma-glutamate biosynthesis protein PgsC/CapC [Halopelagius longus]|nr:poly-gamma-glutamate biosynthesis protein PgsC/CapC [Halopelagius longus]
MELIHGGGYSMIVAAGVTVLGLFAVAVTTQVFGYRLSGTITIPVLAVYTLKNVVTLPVFVLSTLIAYFGLDLLKKRTLIYGRDELLAAILIGSAIPLGLLLLLEAFVAERMRTVLFIGSILPGLAAFNFHQLKPKYRKADIVTSVALFAVLTALGVLLVSPELRPVVGSLTPPVLYSETADVARWRGAVVSEQLQPIILPRELLVGIFGGALAASEGIRRRYDVRIGVIAVGLLAVYALASVWLVVLYVVIFALTYVAISAIHRSTMLYGRVLIGISAGLGLVAAVPLVLQIPIVRGLSAYFVAILAGINAYSAHVTAPKYRVLIPPLQLAAFLPMLAASRYLGTVLPNGIPQRLSVAELAVGAGIVVVCVAFAELYTVHRPSDEDVFEASILSGGGDA